MKRTWLVSVFALSLVLLAACGGDPTQSTTTTTTTIASTTTSTPRPVDDPPTLKITPIAKLNEPTSMAQRDGDNALYITEKTGKIWAIRNSKIDSEPILDLSDEVSNGSEQGLLGMAFAPNKSLFYVNYTDLKGDTHIVEFELSTDARNVVNPASRRELLKLEQPYANHNGGQVAFGPDGLLYLGLGDGGSRGDPQKNGQNLGVLLGKILRINPQPSPVINNDSAISKPLEYTIPYDNPFVDRPGAKGEIWAYGLRNPWRFSFDKVTGDIWIADVGQNKYEEIDTAPKSRAGANYGWSLREGSSEFRGQTPKDAIEPVYEYDHSDGACSVTGGYVYRGSAIPELSQRYLFGDYCNGQMSALTLRGNTWQADKLNIRVEKLTSFGQDHAGELYTLSQSGEVGRIDPS